MPIAALPAFPEFAANVRKALPKATDEEVQSLYDRYNVPEIAQQNPAAERLPTNVDPYKGTTQAVANPTAPNASSLSQFDPAAQDKALEEYKKLYDQTAGQRAMALERGAVAAVGSPAAGQAVRDSWSDLDKENMLRTLGQQKRKEEQATAGQAAFTSAQAREEAAGKFKTEQQKAQQTVDLGALDVATKKRLNDPNSPETALAKKLYVQQVQASGKPLTFEDISILNGATAQNLLPALEPKVVDAFKVSAGLTKSAAETQQALGQAAQSTAEAGRIGAATPGVAAQSAISQGAANTVVGPDGKLQNMPGSNVSIQAGPATIAPSPLTTGQQTAGAEAASRDQKQSTIAANTRMSDLSADLIKTAALADPSPTGLSGSWQARFLPGQKEQARARLDQIVGAKMQYDEAAGMNTIKDKDAEVNRLMELSRNAFQSEMARLNEQVTRQQEMLKARSEYQQRTGSAAGFNPSVIESKTYLVNPRTGAAIFDTMSPEQIKQAEAKGFRKTEDINKIGMK